MREEQLQQVIDNVIDISGIDIRKTRSRKVEVIDAKCAAAIVLRRFYGLSLTEAAEKLKYKHHTTILNFDQNHPYRYRFRPQYAEVYEELCKRSVRSSSINVDELIKTIQEL